MHSSRSTHGPHFKPAGPGPVQVRSSYYPDPTVHGPARSELYGSADRTGTVRFEPSQTDDTTTYSTIILPVGRQTDYSKHLPFPLAPALPMKLDVYIAHKIAQRNVKMNNITMLLPELPYRPCFQCVQSSAARTSHLKIICNIHFHRPPPTVSYVLSSAHRLLRVS